MLVDTLSHVDFLRGRSLGAYGCMQVACGLTSNFPVGNKLGKALSPASAHPKATGAQIVHGRALADL
jgi:hypothetical protein